MPSHSKQFFSIHKKTSWPVNIALSTKLATVGLALVLVKQTNTLGHWRYLSMFSVRRETILQGWKVISTVFLEFLCRNMRVIKRFLSYSLHGLGLLHTVWTAAFAATFRDGTSQQRRKQSKYRSFKSDGKDELLVFLTDKSLFLSGILNLLSWLRSFSNLPQCSAHLSYSKKTSFLSRFKFPNIQISAFKFPVGMSHAAKLHCSVAWVTC